MNIEKGKLSEEQIEALTEIAKQFVEAFKAMWEKLKEFAKKIAPIIKKFGPKLKDYLKQAEQRERKQLFGNVAYTKGQIFKSQVQLNKPKFIKARSHL